MNHLLFIDNLKKIAPTKEDYLKLGISPESALRNAMSFIIPEKIVGEETQLELQGFEIVKLIQNYDFSLFQIGLVSFFHKVKILPSHFLIGNVELDLLAINKLTFEIEILDHDMHSHLIWPCASNEDAFLDALFEFASYIFYKVKNGIYFDNIGELECAARCIEKAGGEKYADFYNMLIQS